MPPGDNNLYCLEVLATFRVKTPRYSVNATFSLISSFGKIEKRVGEMTVRANWIVAASREVYAASPQTSLSRAKRRLAR